MKTIITNQDNSDFDPESMLPEEDPIIPLDLNIQFPEEEELDLESKIQIEFNLLFFGQKTKLVDQFVKCKLLQYRFDDKQKPNYEFTVLIKDQNLVKLMTCSYISEITLFYFDGNTVSEEKTLRSKYSDHLKVDNCQTIKKIKDQYIFRFSI